MINILVPVVEDVDGFAEFVSKHSGSDTRIFVGIKKSLKDKFTPKGANVSLYVFEDKSSREQILNALGKCEKTYGKTLVVRRPLLEEEYQALTTSETEITTLKIKRNKVSAWLKNYAKKIIKKCFAFSFFDDISAICFGEFMFELITACPNLSMATRINKYVGVEISEVEALQPSVKREYKKWKAYLNLALGTFIGFGALAAAVCIFIFVSKIKVLFVVLVIAMLFVALSLYGISLLNFARTLAVGDLEYDAAKVLEEIVQVQPTETAATEKKPKKAKTVASAAKKETKTAKPKASKSTKAVASAKTTSKQTKTTKPKAKTTKTVATAAKKNEKGE
jgi:hypothetical protein